MIGRDLSAKGEIEAKLVGGVNVSCEAQRDIAHASRFCETTIDGLVRQFYLQRIFSLDGEVEVSSGNVNDWGERGCSAIKADFGRLKFDGDAFAIRLIGFHRTHSAKACVAASLAVSYCCRKKEE